LIHHYSTSPSVFENKVVLRALAQLKLEGIKVGLSLSGPEQKSALYKAMEIMVDGIRLFDSVQLTWNILENSTTEALKDAKREGIGVMVKEALANGRLYHYQHEASQLISAMEPIISSKKVSPDMVALAYVAQQDFVDTVLSGAATISHLESNLKISDFELARADVEALDGIYQTPDVYWQTRSRMEWN
ncbi:MAG: aldo/keto reductase, partial [Bacteroidota bacterium]